MLSMSNRNRAQYRWYKIMQMAILLCAISSNGKNDQTNSNFFEYSNNTPYFGCIMFVDSAVVTTGEDTENDTSKARTSIRRNHSDIIAKEKRSSILPTTRNDDAAEKTLLVVEAEQQTPPRMTLWQIIAKAGNRGLGGGIPGAIAGLVQVVCLMWLRTILNYQYRYGISFQKSLQTLYNEGGVQRFYRGISFAVVQAPLSRFVSTAANDGVEAFLSEFKLTEAWGPSSSTLFASVVVGMWRIVLMPIDTCKTVLQVDSVEGFRNLMTKVKAGEYLVLYEGAVAIAVYAATSHYPWFYTYNCLSKNSIILSTLKNDLLRNAAIGFISSAISDTCTNIIRVIKVNKQAFASKRHKTYSEVFALVFEADGWKGLFGRGLRTRILGNALQSVLFTVVWRGLAARWSSDVK